VMLSQYSRFREVTAAPRGSAQSELIARKQILVNVLKIMGSSGECGFSALTTVAATKVISIPTTMIDALILARATSGSHVPAIIV
jgi:hypothetical protein